MEYKIDHPHSEEWLPNEGPNVKTREIFTQILAKGIIGRWKIVTRDNKVVEGYVNQEYKADYLPIYPIAESFRDMLRYDSQKSEFIYNIKELYFYSDSTGKEKPEYIITRPDLTTTNFKYLIDIFGDKYECHSSWDINRPKPAFLKY